MAKIYTKTGDLGETSLIGGKRISKGELRMEAVGTVDELNAWIGLLRDVADAESRKALFKQIQDELFVIGAMLADESTEEKSYLKLGEEEIEILEKEIDKLNESLSPLKHFVLPGGHQFVSYAHLARTVCRRAEREVIRLGQAAEIALLIIKYLNRLSDFLFVLSRKMAQELGVEEVKWEAKI